MEITPRLSPGVLLIDSYGPEGFSIAGQRVSGAVLLTPRSVCGEPLLALSDLSPRRLEELCRMVEGQRVLLLGSGSHGPVAPVPASWREMAAGCGVTLEWMSTPAACRTWNVLMGEERAVAALLLPVAAR